jgi:hypothetical protein
MPVNVLIVDRIGKATRVVFGESDEMMFHMPKRCSANDCKRRVHARGLCRKHYDLAEYTGRLHSHPSARTVRWMERLRRHRDGRAKSEDSR